MKFRLFLYIIITVLFFASCERSLYSEREKSLFISPIYGENIILDSLHNLDDLLTYFDRIYCEKNSATKWPVLYFDMNKKEVVNPSEGENIIALGIEPSPCDDIMFDYDFSRILEVMKDGYNLEVEDQRIEPDSLSPYIAKQYLNFGQNPLYSTDPQNNGIWLITNKDDKLVNLNSYIAQIIEGYILMAKQYSQMQYHTSLDSLSDEEFKELKATLAFHLSFKFSDEAPQIINTLF